MLVAACGRFDFDGRALDAASSVDTPSSAACAYELCDGFEGSAIADVWTAIGNVSLDSTVAHRGSQSLHIHSDAVAAGSNVAIGIVETATLGSSNAPINLRVFARFGSLPVNHMGLVGAAQVSDDPFADGVYETSGGLTVYSEFSNTSVESMVQPTPGDWTCVTFGIVRADDATGSLILGGDGSAELDDVATDGVPRLAAAGVGIAFASSTDVDAEPALDLWIDDVIVANAPLTCAD
jgi:hypothetical protein